MEPMHPQFTVIVPVYKAEKYLPKCLESILKQTNSDFELILVDDGSPDNSPAICDAYAARDNRIKVIHKENGGVVRARNEGLFSARGEYIYYVDADDWIKENLLETVNSIIAKWNSPDIVMFASEKVYESHSEYMKNYLEAGYYDKERLVAEVYPNMIYDRRLPFLTSMIIGQLWNKVMKRSLLLEHYLKDASLYKSEDFACVYECLYYAKSLYYCDEAFYFYNKTNEVSAMTVYDKTYFRNHNGVVRYVNQHIGGEEAIKQQMQAYNASGIIIGIFHEMRHGIPITAAAKHIREEIGKTQDLSGISLQGLPIHAKVFMGLVKLRMYRIALLGAKIWLNLTK